MNNDDIKKPAALKIRGDIQDLITDSMPSKKFSKNSIDLVNIDVKLNSLGWNFNNYRILNITDIHLGQWINPEYLCELTDYINTLDVDLIALTGDYVSYVLDDYVEDLKNSFKRLKAKDGKFAVLGNHDHWMGASKIREILKESDVVDLSNDVHTIFKDNESINIAGVDSCTVGKDDLDLVLEKLPDDNPSILLVHEPDFAEKSAKTDRFDLQISGHSHGGQFIIPGVDTTPFRGKNSQKYPLGKYQIGNMIQYTSKGLGTNSFRIRINCKPEITVFTLKTGEHKIIRLDD